MPTVFRRGPRQIGGICAAALILVLLNELLGFLTGFQFALTPISDYPNFYNIHTTSKKKVLSHKQTTPVNEDGPHPIYELMEQAEKDWKRKLERASTTLEQAVREYRRRYHRYPPKGFDLWWQYVAKHNVQLPDEYDSIYHDLEPFWGLQPTELLKIREELESKINSYTIGKDAAGRIAVVNYAFEEGKYEQFIRGSEAIIDLLADIEDDLPLFRANYFVRASTLRAAHDGACKSACFPSSPARQKPFNLNHPPPRPENKTFVYDHLRSMDPCLHPDHFHHHGQFLYPQRGPIAAAYYGPRIFILFDCHTSRYTYTYTIWLAGRHLSSYTGIFHNDKTRWQGSHRDFLVKYANDLNGTLSVLRPTSNETEIVGSPKEYHKSRLNPALIDIAFAGKPTHSQSIKHAGNYKYIIDVDGNGWSGRFKRVITSNSLIFKATVYPEWYLDRVAPWLHYVPIQIDLSDLHDALVFFHGDANGEGAHDELAHLIALEGRKWSKNFWRRQDLIAYFFRLILEYSRLMSLDRESMTYFLPS
ncbi:glycosyl transferase family 90-domain-containing protein [Amanita rubescens]|nr:glycosyl transferase family 90-domain-containing protein [Amanita rubescens]